MKKKEETKKGDTHRIKYRGVMLRRSGKWAAATYDSSKQSTIWLGTFNTPEQAATAYDNAALRIRRRNAILNFPPPPPLPKPRDQEVPATTLIPKSRIPYQESAYSVAHKSIYSEINQFVADYRLKHQQEEEYILRVNSQLVELQLHSLSSLMQRSTMPFSPSSNPVGNSVKSEFLRST